jgi:hypothetical protein
VKIGSAFCFFLLATLGTSAASARPRPHPANDDTSHPEYVYALAAANHFMHAWQTGDTENGMVELSDGLRHSQNADSLEEYFSNASSNSKARSFEITRGTGHSGRYDFPVVLVSLRGSHVTRKFSDIVVIETGKNDWVVDKLP